MLCSLADGLAALQAQGVEARRVILVGGGAQSAAVQQAASQLLGMPVLVPAPGEYVADGAARQAAAVLAGVFPDWAVRGVSLEAEPSDGRVLAMYRKHAGTYLA